MSTRAREIAVLLTIVALMLVLAWRTTGYFSLVNLTDLFLANMPVMIIAVGMTLIILTGEDRYLGRLYLRHLQCRDGIMCEPGSTGSNQCDGRMCCGCASRCS